MHILQYPHTLLVYPHTDVSVHTGFSDMRMHGYQPCRRSRRRIWLYITDQRGRRTAPLLLWITSYDVVDDLWPPGAHVDPSRFGLSAEGEAAPGSYSRALRRGETRTVIATCSRPARPTDRATACRSCPPTTFLTISNRLGPMPTTSGLGVTRRRRSYQRSARAGRGGYTAVAETWRPLLLFVAGPIARMSRTMMLPMI